jgi:hypothetical protein
MTFDEYRNTVAERYQALPEHEKEAIRRLVYSTDGGVMKKVLGQELLGSVQFVVPKILDTET